MYLHPSELPLWFHWLKEKQLCQDGQQNRSTTLNAHLGDSVLRQQIAHQVSEPSIVHHRQDVVRVWLEKTTEYQATHYLAE